MVLAGLATWAITRNYQPTNEQAPAVSSEPETKEPTIPTLTFVAMGDMLAHDSVVNQAKTENGYDFKPYFEHIKPLYAGSDVVFCNPETPSTGQTHGIGGYPTFNAPTEFSKDLVDSGCNMINLATNHIADKGQSALEQTVDQWHSLDVLAVSGANKSAEEQQQVSFFTKNDIKVAFVAFADFSNAGSPAPYSINFYRDTVLVEKLLTEARKNADLVIVSAHWGAEDSHQLNDNQRAAAQQMANLGADVIIGTGPHVVQPVEWVERADGKKTLVWYSIGNMLSSQLQVDQLTSGVAKFKVTKKDAGVEISDIAFDGTFMSYEWSAADRAASRLHTRRNLQLKPLADAEAEVGLFGVNVEERSQKLREWLGSSVEVKIRP